MMIELKKEEMSKREIQQNNTIQVLVELNDRLNKQLLGFKVLFSLIVIAALVFVLIQLFTSYMPDSVSGIFSDVWELNKAAWKSIFAHKDTQILFATLFLIISGTVAWRTARNLFL